MNAGEEDTDDTPLWFTTALVGAVAVVVPLGVVAWGAGLPESGWAAGVACAALIFGLLGSGGDAGDEPLMTAANRVTAGRALLVATVVALVAARTQAVGTLVAVAAVALALNGVDGAVARRTGTASRLGARFDMETDAVLIFALSVRVAGSLGAWVLLIGTMRYVLWAAQAAFPVLRAGVPARCWRKAVAAAQGIVLVAAASGAPPRALSVTLVAGALGALAWSFGTEIVEILSTAPVSRVGGSVQDHELVSSGPAGRNRL